ncbi:hypothetical protein FH972_002582 [Carpinus fangiana]|uniref:Secreted protein n=1 Tax=Carpinus fangiana TaxID=176857 RepID=A0A5N6QFA8_9ROSI|nr:hypothetical protein FH972_002582 [Carpinus fangiana]
MTHLASVLVLLLKIHTIKSCAVRGGEENEFANGTLWVLSKVHLRRPSFLFLGFRGISRRLIVFGMLSRRENVGSMPLVGVVMRPLGE